MNTTSTTDNGNKRNNENNMSFFHQVSWLNRVNSFLESLDAKEVILWSILTFPRLFQTSALGPSGLVIMDMVQAIQQQYHFISDNSSQELSPPPLPPSQSIPLNNNNQEHTNNTPIFSNKSFSSSSTSWSLLKPSFSSLSSSHNNTSHELKEHQNNRNSNYSDSSVNETSNSPIVPLIFLDTLYHFPETLSLAQTVANRYNSSIYVFKPSNANSREDFEKIHGTELWIKNQDVYDFLIKAEPAQRAYTELNVQAVFTGRRRSQQGERSKLKVIESSNGVLKINPLAKWSFDQVWSYIKEHNVPYNPLHDLGYKSIGDYHSTSIPKDPNANERDGRWENNPQKTECGLHKDYFKMRMKYKQMASGNGNNGGISVDASSSVSC